MIGRPWRPGPGRGHRDRDRGVIVTVPAAAGPGRDPGRQGPGPGHHDPAAVAGQTQASLSPQSRGPGIRDTAWRPAGVALHQQSGP